MFVTPPRVKGNYLLSRIEFCVCSATGLNFCPYFDLCSAKRYWQGTAAADACASGNMCQIGGFIRATDGRTLWFSERFEQTDFPLNEVPLNPQNAKACHLLGNFSSDCTFSDDGAIISFIPLRQFCLKSLSDNTGAESGSNRMFTTSSPLCLFLEKLCLIAAISCMEMDVSHIPGSANVSADLLSRWDFQAQVDGFDCPIVFDCHSSIYGLILDQFHSIL